MANPFRSINGNGPARFTADQVLAEARTLLEQHNTAREAATKAANARCGNCHGTGSVASIVAEGSFVRCWACDGTGEPNDKIQTLPDLTEDDQQRLWKLRQLLRKYPKQRSALLALIREYFPTMYADSTMSESIN